MHTIQHTQASTGGQMYARTVLKYYFQYTDVTLNQNRMVICSNVYSIYCPY